MNVVCLAGRLGQTADLRYTANGTAVTNFSLAVDRFGKDKDGEKLGPLWVSVQVWGKQAEGVTQYLTKGKVVAIMGELLPVKTWTTKDGDNRVQLEINARRITLLGGGEAPQKAAATPEVADDEMPF